MHLLSVPFSEAPRIHLWGFAGEIRPEVISQPFFDFQSALIPYSSSHGFEFAKSKDKIHVKINMGDFFDRPEPEPKLPKWVVLISTFTASILNGWFFLHAGIFHIPHGFHIDTPVSILFSLLRLLTVFFQFPAAHFHHWISKWIVPFRTQGLLSGFAPQKSISRQKRHHCGFCECNCTNKRHFSRSWAQKRNDPLELQPWIPNVVT